MPACTLCRGTGRRVAYVRALRRRSYVTCGRCDGKGEEPSESWRDFRRRVIDPTRGGAS